MRVLIIEDNRKMASFIRQGLAELGYNADTAATGQEGEALATSEQPYDVIVLDLMLPDRDGVEVCRSLRAREVTSMILILTSLSTTADKISGLNAGADDYLTKPFEFDELVARIRALVRRQENTDTAVLRFEDIEMDLLGHKVSRGGQRIKLSNKEFALLEYLVRNPNRVLTRAAIASHVWDMNMATESNVIDVYVGLLRRKLESPSSPRLIHTVVGMGYVLSTENPNA